MKNLLLFATSLSIFLLISCGEKLGGNGGADDEMPPIFFITFFIEGSDKQDLFSLSSYSADSTLQKSDANGDGVYGIYTLLPFTISNNKTVFNWGIGTLARGISDFSTSDDNFAFESSTLISFSNGDIDTLQIFAQCNETCWYDDKTMQVFFNGELIHDFDFRDKDAELLQRLMDNNYPPYGDTVVFEIPKVPEF